MNQQRFLNKYGPWAVVTGASDGIGLAVSEALAAIGTHPVLVARRPDRLYALSSDLTSKYGTETVVIPITTRLQLLMVWRNRRPPV